MQLFNLFPFQGKGGPYCEFRVRVQADRTTLLESVKNPLQFITIGPDGSPGEVRGILDKEPTRRFYVYAKVSEPHHEKTCLRGFPVQHKLGCTVTEDD